ncbi:hypothetical protein [Nocardia wallacei]|nr:hypothetical protein [Nocardia wallacei]
MFFSELDYWRVREFFYRAAIVAGLIVTLLGSGVLLAVSIASRGTPDRST